MAQLLIRNLNPATIKQLKLRAVKHHRSLQGELKYIVEMAVKMSMKETLSLSQSWHKKLKNKTFSDSAQLLREDRDR